MLVFVFRGFELHVCHRVTALARFVEERTLYYVTLVIMSYFNVLIVYAGHHVVLQCTDIIRWSSCRTSMY